MLAVAIALSAVAASIALCDLVLFIDLPPPPKDEAESSPGRDQAHSRDMRARLRRWRKNEPFGRS
jgi:hypothetical protein